MPANTTTTHTALAHFREEAGGLNLIYIDRALRRGRGAQGDATTARAHLEEQIADRRREIQYAADAQWPAGANGNAGIRGEFQIPLDRALA